MSTAQAAAREGLGGIKTLAIWWAHGIGAQLAFFLGVIPAGFAFGFVEAATQSVALGVAAGVAGLIATIWGYGLAKLTLRGEDR